jgi:MFS family permease
VGASLAGFAVFWSATSLPLLVAGLALVGLGVANLFPLITSAMFAAAPGLADRASAHVSLAGGTAVMVAPLTLGALADRWELRSAFAGVLVLLVALAGTVAWWARAQGGRITPAP